MHPNKALSQMTTTSFLSYFNHKVELKWGREHPNVDCITTVLTMEQSRTSLYHALGIEVNTLCAQSIFQNYSQILTFKEINKQNENHELRKIIEELPYTLHDGWHFI